MRSRLTALTALGFVAVIAACDSTGSTGPQSDNSYLRASINGALNTSYEGSGQFWLGTGTHRPTQPSTFSLFSAGHGASTNQTFLLFRPGAELPKAGTYTLGVAGAGFQAHFSRTADQGQTLEAFAASSGELKITRSSPERLEGHFRMTGFQFCHRDRAGSRPNLTCVVPTSVDPDAPTITVEGSFSAVPFDGEVIQMR